VEHTGEDDDESITEKDLGYNYYNTSIKSGIVLGVALELVVVTLSGYAAIYFEKAIKNDPFNIWERNFQLGFYSILMYTVLILSDNSGKPFSNWTTMAYILSVLGAAGGLLVALSIKYGDSVLKTLAISGSIIHANIVDHIFLGGPLDEHMFLSAIIVVIAVLNYNFDAS
jgi:UDP-sugar transporter A1/2/3